MSWEFIAGVWFVLDIHICNSNCHKMSTKNYDPFMFYRKSIFHFITASVMSVFQSVVLDKRILSTLSSIGNIMFITSTNEGLRVKVVFVAKNLHKMEKEVRWRSPLSLSTLQMSNAFSRSLRVVQSFLQ